MHPDVLIPLCAPCRSTAALTTKARWTIYRGWRYIHPSRVWPGRTQIYFADPDRPPGSATPDAPLWHKAGARRLHQLDRGAGINWPPSTTTAGPALALRQRPPRPSADRGEDPRRPPGCTLTKMWHYVSLMYIIFAQCGPRYILLPYAYIMIWCLCTKLISSFSNPRRPAQSLESRTYGCWVRSPDLQKYIRGSNVTLMLHYFATMRNKAPSTFKIH